MENLRTKVHRGDPTQIQAPELMQVWALGQMGHIFTRSFLPEFTRFKESHAFLMGYKRTTYHTPCIAPWCCFINMGQYRSYKLKFFDMTRMLYINDNRDYDTGGSLYEDAERLNLPIISTEDNTFYIHFKGGSVFKERGLLWLRKNQAIWA